MDKQELREMIGEIKKAYARGDFDRVLMFADEMNIRKLTDSRTLEMIADAYAYKGELEQAREILLMAYEKTPMGRKMAYKLSELSIALDDLDNAVEFYEDFCKMAPHDNDRYLLKYKIGKAGGVSAEDLAKVLSLYCSKEVDEKWMYELAALYYKLRDKEKCLEICDNIILWFANGDYVQKAKSLKTRLGAEAETDAAAGKDGNGAGQLGGDIPLEGFIDMSGAQPAAEKRPQPQVSPARHSGMEEITDAFLEDAIRDQGPAQEMAIGDAMAIAEAKEQAEMAEAFERVTKPELPRKKPASSGKYGRFEGNVTFETVPEKAQEGTPYEVNGEVITLPKTTFEDMSHDWTIPEELLNAEDSAPQPEVFEEPVYGSHRYVPPTEQPKPAYEEPVFGAHRVVTKAEEEAAQAAKVAELEAQLEAAKEALKQEEAKRAALAAEVAAEKAAEAAPAPAEAVPVTQEAAPVAEEAAPATEEAAPAIEQAAPEMPAEAEAAPAYGESMSFIPQQPEEPIPEQPMEAELQVSDNPAIAAVIEPMAEPVAEIEREKEGFDAAFPQSLDDASGRPAVPNEISAAYAEAQKEEIQRRGKEEDSPATILFAISPREEDEGAPDELVLPESVQAEVESARVAERKAAETKEPEKKPYVGSRLQTPIEPAAEAAPAEEAAPAATEVIRPARTIKYSSVSSIFAEEEPDNIDGQITLDSMFATYSKREAAPEGIVPEMPEVMQEEEEPVRTAVEDEFPVDEGGIAVDENEPPLITELGGDFSSRPQPAYEQVREQEPESAGGEVSDFEKAMQAYDEARAEGKEGFDFQSLFAKASDGEFSEGAEEPEYEEYEEQLFDEETEEYDEFDEEGGLEDFEDGSGDEETGDAWDEDSYEEYDEEYADDEYEDETEDGFDQEYDDYEDGEYDDEYEEEYEEEPYDEEYEEELYEEEEYVEDGYEEEPFEEETQAYEEEAYEEEPYEEDEYAEEYEEEPYEDELEDGYEETYPEDGEDAYEEYEDEYEEEPYEDDYDDYYADDYVMPNSLKEELAEFLLIDGMEERINRTIGNLIAKKKAGDPTGGNLIVTGDTKSGKTYLTIAVIKAVGQEIGGNSRVAKVKAEALNGKNMAKVFEKIAGSDLLIENVGYLTDETVDSLIDMLSDQNLSSMVALEGNQLAIDNMISKHPELNDLFQTRLNVSELSLAQWADLACQYAEERGYTVSDMALLALHAKIDELNVPTERLGYDNIRGIIDNAIANASKRGGGKFRFGSKKHKGNAKQLEEADFM